MILAEGIKSEYDELFKSSIDDFLMRLENYMNKINTQKEAIERANRKRKR